VSDKLNAQPASSASANGSAAAPSLSFDRAAGARILATRLYPGAAARFPLHAAFGVARTRT